MRIGFDAKKIVKNATGIGNYSRSLLNALAQNYPQHEFYLFAQSGGKERLYRHLLQRTNTLLRTPALSCPVLRPLQREFWRCHRVMQDAAKENISIYHGLSNEIPFGNKGKHIRRVVTRHDLIFLRYPRTYSWLARQILKFKTQYASRHADAIIAISQQTKKDLMAFYGTAPERIHVIYQGCGELFYQTQTETQREAVRQKFHLSQQFLLSVGTIQERKNQALAIRALREVEEDIQLVLVGSKTPYQDELVKLAHQLNLSHRVLFLNSSSNEELAALYQMASAFLYTSIYEGFGIPILEALVSGLPVISAPGSCLPEVAGPDSLYAPYDDPSAWAKSIHQVLNDEELANRMSAKGKEYAKRFAWDHIAKEVMNLYEKMLTRA